MQVNLGDEIGIAAPPSYANDTAFEEYCKQHAISLDMLGCDDTNCELLACQGPVPCMLHRVAASLGSMSLLVPSHDALLSSWP